MRTHLLQQECRRHTALIVFAVVLLFVLALAAASDDGYGPDISVPRELPKAISPIKRLLVDQTREDAHRKSVGHGIDADVLSPALHQDPH